MMDTIENRITLILDYDGTLHDSRAIYEPAFRKAMLELENLGWIEHREYTTEEIVFWVGFSATEMWLRFHPELDEQQRNYAARLIGKYMREFLTGGSARLYPGTENQLEALKKKYRLVFLSNCDREYMENHRKIFKLDRWFEEFYCTGDYAFASKDKVFAEHIYVPGRIYVAVGDRIKDIQLARNCGLKGVGCLYGFGSKEELSAADITINDISELGEALAKIL